MATQFAEDDAVVTMDDLLRQRAFSGYNNDLARPHGLNRDEREPLPARGHHDHVHLLHCAPDPGGVEPAVIRDAGVVASVHSCVDSPAHGCAERMKLKTCIEQRQRLKNHIKAFLIIKASEISNFDRIGFISLFRSIDTIVGGDSGIDKLDLLSRNPIPARSAKFVKRHAEDLVTALREHAFDETIPPLGRCRHVRLEERPRMWRIDDSDAWMVSHPHIHARKRTVAVNNIGVQRCYTALQISRDRPEFRRVATRSIVDHLDAFYMHATIHLADIAQQY